MVDGSAGNLNLSPESQLVVSEPLFPSAQSVFKTAGRSVVGVVGVGGVVGMVGNQVNM